LPPGTYRPHVAFRNVTNGHGSTDRIATLIVQAPSLSQPPSAPTASTSITASLTLSTNLDARQFSTVTHAGTVSDPWPGTAIQSALMALPSTGGTVTVADGVWLFDSALKLNGMNNFTLVGQSTNAHLMFTGAGQMWFNTALNTNLTMTATISKLTIDCSYLPSTSNYAAIRFSNAANSYFINNHVIGCTNTSVPAVFY